MQADAEQNPPQPLLRSISDTVTILGVGRTTIYQLIDEGKLRQVKIGRRRLITAQSIADYVAEISA